MFNKVEMISAGIAIVCMTLALILIQNETSLTSIASAPDQQLASVQQASIAVIDNEATNENKREVLAESMDSKGNLKNMVIDDVKIGIGAPVKEGDTVAVHYSGTLQNGQEFDNSRKRGEPFVFNVGGGQVIKGWDEGLVGMQVGGQRILVIPPDMAYGENGIGPIPGNATLVFSIELMEIK